MRTHDRPENWGALPDVGDLAFVARAHCDKSEELLFKIVRVQAIVVTTCHCQYCWTNTFGELALTNAHSGYMRAWLRRIPPLEELESKMTEEPAHA